MDERYWIVKDCLNALRARTLPHERQFELEVKFLKLRVELLKEEGAQIVRKDAFENLKLLVQEFVADLHGRDSYREVLQCLDTLLTEVRDQAA